MKISMQAMSVDVFISMLTSLSEILDKGAEHAQAAHLDLINARLAPDMYPLSQQVRIACDQARNGVARITGAAPTVSADEDKTFDDLKARIAGTIEFLRSVRAPDFEGAEERDCSIPGPNGIVFQMNGLSSCAPGRCRTSTSTSPPPTASCATTASISARRII